MGEGERTQSLVVKVLLPLGFRFGNCPFDSAR